MIAAFTGFATAIQALGIQWWKTALGALLAFAPAFLLGQCSVHVDRICNGREATKAVKSMAVDRVADDGASVARRNDDAEVARKSQQVKDATNALPDAPLSPRQHARACVVLGQQHASPADIASAGC